MSRVALPNATTSRPVANGSSVPVCPARTPPRARRVMATTSCELAPAGLSISRMPSLLDVAIPGWFLGSYLLQEGIDACGVGDAGVVLEVEFRRDAQTKRSTQFGAEVSGHGLQALHRGRLFGFRSEDAHVNAGV